MVRPRSESRPRSDEYHANHWHNSPSAKWYAGNARDDARSGSQTILHRESQLRGKSCTSAILFRPQSAARPVVISTSTPWPGNCLKHRLENVTLFNALAIVCSKINHRTPGNIDAHNWPGRCRSLRAIDSDSLPMAEWSASLKLLAGRRREYRRHSNRTAAAKGRKRRKGRPAPRCSPFPFGDLLSTS
jgi:hypothetical protein